MVIPVVRTGFEDGTVARRARRSRYACRRGNSSNPKRRRASRCVFAASPCRRRCRGRFCRWPCACRRRFCCLMQRLSCRLKQSVRSYLLNQYQLVSHLLPPGDVRPTPPVCRRHPARCACRWGSGRSPTRRCFSFCPIGVADSLRRRRDRDGLVFLQGACPACRARPATSFDRDWARAGS